MTKFTPNTIAYRKKYAISYRKTPKYRYAEYKSRAKVSGFPFLLSFEQFMAFWQQPCAYCGSIIETIGLDRIDNSLGYSEENCIACCIVCNRMKFIYTNEFFIAHCKKIAGLE